MYNNLAAKIAFIASFTFIIGVMLYTAPNALLFIGTTLAAVFFLLLLLCGIELAADSLIFNIKEHINRYWARRRAKEEAARNTDDATRATVKGPRRPPSY